MIMKNMDNKIEEFHDANTFVIQDTSHTSNQMEDLNETFGGEYI